MRLIDADALKSKLSDTNYVIYTREYGKAAIAIPVELVTNAIDNAPTVEPHQDKERVTIEMSEEEIEKFGQMLIDIFKDILKEAKNDNL